MIFLEDLNSGGYSVQTIQCSECFKTILVKYKNHNEFAVECSDCGKSYKCISNDKTFRAEVYL